MRLRQDIEIGYEIRSNEHSKRRGGIFSPRKGGGRSNLSNNRKVSADQSHTSQQSPIPARLKTHTHNHTQPQTQTQAQMQTQTKSRLPPPSSPPLPKKPLLQRPTSAPPKPPSPIIQRPKTAELPQRVRKAFVRPADNAPWDNSTSNVDREYLITVQDNEISKYRQGTWELPVSAHQETVNIGPSHESDRKTITTSYSRCRDARTSGPILNIHTHHVGFAQKTAERISEITSTGIHNSLWNVSTKDRDEEPRAKPELSSTSKSSETFHELFYSNDAWKEITFRGVIKTQQTQPQLQALNKTWDDIKKIPLNANNYNNNNKGILLPQQRTKKR